MGIWMIKGMVISLTLTLILELLFAVCCRVTGKKEIRLVILVNVLTNPIVVFFTYMGYLYPVIHIKLLITVLEVAAVVTEALLYKKYSQKVTHPWIFSIGINGFSYIMGEIINQL